METKFGRRDAAPWAVLLAFAVVPSLSAQWIPTNVGNGADAEVREAFPLLNLGASNELASRILNVALPPGDVNDRNSLMYTRFDLSTAVIPPSFETAFRLTYRNNNLREERIQDSITPDPTLRTGISVYGLDPMATGADWDESTITYANAPGMTPDGDIGTRDLNGDLVFLGTVLFPEIGTQNWLPVGGQLVLRSPALDQFVADAIDSGATEVTLVSHVMHDANVKFVSWLNFNYLFNPKEQTILDADASYDADITDPSNPLGSPWSEGDNSTGEFSPSLLIEPLQPSGVEIPTVSTVGAATLIGLLLVAGLTLVRRRSH
jgi:hypothetical protein